MKIEFVLIIFTLFFNFSFSQISVNVNIKNEQNIALETVNCQIINSKSNKIVAFGVTDLNGDYFFEIKEIGIYKIKASYIGYEPTVKEVEINTNKEFELILKENSNFLKEVIVKANSSGMKQNGDTLTYAVDKFMNGTEETLKDIVKKLPGLDINSNGQITSNGKEVQKILVDGEDFFQNQHKLATENLSSKMIKNIELIKNFKDFKNISPDSKTDVTAININIKDAFKNKITGNLKTAIGYQEKYNIHSNLFSFRKKNKTTVITGFNNSGEQEFTTFDYYQLTDINKIYDDNYSGVEIPNQDDVPKFLFANRNAKSRKTEFTALNSVFTPNKKLKFYVYSIFNNSKQIQNQNLKQDYFLADFSFINIENNTILENSLFSSTNLETTYKPNSKNLINFKSTFNFLKTTTNNEIENISNFNINYFTEKGIQKQFNLYNKIEYSKTFKSKDFLSINIFQSYNNTQNIKKISSNNPFLNLTFNDNLFEIYQNKKNNNLIFEYDSKYSFNLKKKNVIIICGSKFETSKIINTVENQIQFENNLLLQNNDSFIGLDFNYFPSNIVNLNFGITNHNLIIKNYPNSNFDFNYLSPKAKIKAIFNPNHVLELNYSFSNNLPSYNNLFSNRIIQDYRNIYKNDEIKFNTILPNHQASLTYFYFKQPKFNFILNLNYTFNEKFINLNSQNESASNLNEYRLFSNENIFSGIYFIEKYFPKSKLSIKHNFAFNSFKRPLIFENEINIFKLKSYSIDLKIVSSFKKFPINFETGVVLLKNTYANSGSNTEFNSIEILSAINGKFVKNVFWSLDFNKTFQQSEFQNQNLLLINPKIRYSKKKYDLSIYGNNILNLKNTQSIENSSLNNYIEYKTNQILAGFLMIELKCKI